MINSLFVSDLIGKNVLFFRILAEVYLDGEEWNDGLLATIRERVNTVFSVLCWRWLNSVVLITSHC